jgi:3'-5' exoribonuclease
MSRTSIAEFEVGRPTEGVFAVVRKARRLNRNGEPYLALELSDQSGTIPARVWQNAEHFDRVVQTGDHVVAVGKPSIFQGNMQFDVRRLERVDAEGESFVPMANRPLDEFAGELDFLIDEIVDDAFRGVCERLWRGPLREDLLRSPATVSDHHSYLGGLAEHTISVATICMAACDRHAHLNRSLLATAALCHDVGRMREIRVGDAIGADEQGSLYGHLLLSHEMVTEAGRDAGALDHPAWAELVHAIAQHHGPSDRCRTREAQVLLFANQLDVRAWHA